MAYKKSRHDKSEIELRNRMGELVYKNLFGSDVKRIYLHRGDIRDLEDGIDLYRDGISTGERLRESHTNKGKDLCVLNDVTIRTRTKDGKKLEMYTSKAKEFIYAIENYKKNGICRAYRTDMQGIKEHYLKGDFSCREIQNDDGNYFVPIDVNELDKYNLIKNRFIEKEKEKKKEKTEPTSLDEYM